VDCFIECLKDPAAENKIYNVATGRKTTVSELLKNIFIAAGKKDHPYRSEGTTPGDTFGIFADISKITSEVSWRPRMSLEEGLKKMYDHYLSRMEEK